MKKLIISLVLSAPLVLLGGCAVDTVTVNTVAYDPGYNNDYIYSVGYYNNRPYWGNNHYYTGYNWGTGGYWGGNWYNGY